MAGCVLFCLTFPFIIELKILKLLKFLNALFLYSICFTYFTLFFILKSIQRPGYNVL